MSINFESRLKAQALGLGFDLAGVTRLGPAETHAVFTAWLASGKHGSMAYLARGAELRADTTRPEPGMRSAVVVALDYGGRAPEGPVARYARGSDYHRLMWDRLESLLEWVRAERGAETRGRAYVDTGPILERDLARRAGLGWFGKNTMLIHPEKGSFFFLGALFLDLDLAPDAPFAGEHCGTCTRCLDACPTAAIVAPGELDARRCISYLTIEHRGDVDPGLAPLLGEHLYGCDICQDVCPWNVKFASELREPAFAPRAPITSRDDPGCLASARELAQHLLDMDEPTYRQHFRDSAMTRAKREGLQRNARIVLRNLGSIVLALVLGVATPTRTVAQSAPTPQPARTDTTTRDSTRIGTPATATAPIIVQATRSRRRVEDEPLRVEVLGREEIEEKLLMTPGDITMLLNETSGLRVQSTSPALGGASVRVHGMSGRYTQILVDGLPLQGAETGSFSLLQIPPMDLGGVEVVKGVSSAMYGGNALGGVVNLISRRPDEGRTQDVLLNVTSLGGKDAVYFFADTIRGGRGVTLLAGLHTQPSADIDGDSWLDVPEYRRLVLRPRFFRRTAGGGSEMFTLGFTADTRRGGFGGGGSAASVSREELGTQRADAGAVVIRPVGMNFLTLRGAHTTNQHSHTFGILTDRDVHSSTFGEASLTGAALGGIWVLGAAVQYSAFSARSIPGFDESATTPGVFAQHTFDLGTRTAATASVRTDVHSKYGAQTSPRLSVLRQLGHGWSVRASAGGGYFTPTPFVEEVEAVGLRQLDPLLGLRVEHAQSVSMDLGGFVLGLELLATLFASDIRDAVAARESASDSSRIELVNLDGVTRTRGAEILLRARPGPLHLSLSLTRLASLEPDALTGIRRERPLTPEFTLGFLAAWENERYGRIGVEVYHTGRQFTPDDELSEYSPAFTHFGVLVERRIGSARIFLNGENLFDVRQTKHAPILRSSPGLGGRRTTDVWGPLEGRVLNLGVRF